jgi:hypothetical protein
MASLFAQPYISPPDYDTVGFPPKKDSLLVQKSAVDGTSVASKATRWLGKKYRRSKSMLAA